MAGNIICPYCYTEQKLKKMSKCCINDTCAEYSKGTLFPASTTVCPSCETTLRYACTNPKCKHPIEREELQCDNPLPIAIIGARFSGKSNYIAVVIKELQIKGNRFGISIRANPNTADKYAKEYEKPVYKDMRPITTTVAATKRIKRDPLVYMFTTGLNGGKKGTFPLSFYDTAGENMEKSDIDTEEFVDYITYAKGIIILMDPWQIPYVKQSLGDIIPANMKSAVGLAPYDILERTIRVIRNKATNLKPTQKIDIPIAIAFSKIDSLESAGLIDEVSCLTRESSHIDARKYSKLEHDDTNSEIESMLKAFSEEEAERFINLADANFKTYSFFGFSSFGCGVNTNNTIKEKVKPRRVLDPFLWLLSINKRINTTK